MKVLNRKLRVLAPSYEMGASGYYRVELPLILLRHQKRMDCIWRNLLQINDDMIRNDSDLRARLMSLVAWADIIFLERESRENMASIINRCRESGKKIVMDIDDHVTRFVDIPSEQVAEYWRENSHGFLSILGLVDGLICTTDRMANFYQEFMKEGAKAYCIPNYIDTSTPRWKNAIEKRLQIHNDDVFIVGWMGGHTHAKDLEIVRPALKRAIASLPIMVKFVGLVPEWASELPQDRIICDSGYTTLDQYPSRYCDFDIGLIPLERNEFNDIGKSDLKFLEYGILGIPAIVSRSPAYNSVANKKTGLIVDDDADSWYNAIKYLIENEKLRKAISSNVIKYVFRQRSADNNVYRWADVFKDLFLKE